MDAYRRIVREKLVEPARVSTDLLRSQMELVVAFDDGRTVRRKIDPALKTFLCVMRNLSIERYEEEDCVPERLGFFELFGYRAGDRLRLRSRDASFNVRLVSSA